MAIEDESQSNRKEALPVNAEESDAIRKKSSKKTIDIDIQLAKPRFREDPFIPRVVVTWSTETIFFSQGNIQEGKKS
ncbi:hypothetical protein CEXT_97761 [Caerostris extrusa]|uniref:Uncharacterized protein n=1 Tax=Caerostris extrusa TaxID=172846 RepID=A0AAV4XQ47_CAEEX|nr:hypothetical protein CEXT_97761 [Caerostris extrusa]